LNNRLPDLDDEPFLEVAIAGRAACLITGNKSHYPHHSRQGIKVLSPSEFIDFYIKARKTQNLRFQADARKLAPVMRGVPATPSQQ
jgi:hypothetical protein